MTHDEEWIDCTVVGSAYECQVSLRARPARYRHRPATHPRIFRLDAGPEVGRVEIEHEWKPGVSPDMKGWQP